MTDEKLPEAAESCTDVGQEDEETEDTMWFWAVCVVIIITILAAAAWKVMT